MQIEKTVSGLVRVTMTAEEAKTFRLAVSDIWPDGHFGKLAKKMATDLRYAGIDLPAAEDFPPRNARLKF